MYLTLYKTLLCICVPSLGVILNLEMAHDITKYLTLSFLSIFTREISLPDDTINSEPYNQILETFSLILYIATKFFTLKLS